MAPGGRCQQMHCAKAAAPAGHRGQQSPGPEYCSSLTFLPNLAEQGADHKDPHCDDVCVSCAIKRGKRRHHLPTSKRAAMHVTPQPLALWFAANPHPLIT